MDLGSELAMQIRNIAAEVANNTAANKVAVLEGRIASYNQDNGTLQVTLAHYYTPDKPEFTVNIPYALFMAGNGYGDYFYAEQGQACIVLAFADGGAGDWVQAFLLHDTLNPPASFNGGTGTITAPLQPGDRAIFCKGGWLIRAGSGKIQLGSNTDGGTTPAAVEGSTSTHAHALDTFAAAINTACASCVGFLPLSPVPGTYNTETTAAAVDTGQGAQSVLLPAPGES